VYGRPPEATVSTRIFRAHFAEQRGDLVVIEVAGELDVESAASLRDSLRAAEDLTPARTIIDLTGLEFADSSGLAVLLAAARRSFLVEREVALVSPEGPVRRLIHIAGVDAVVPVYETREQALPPGPTS
jgi:anti-anti-sigma factor